VTVHVGPRQLGRLLEAVMSVASDLDLNAVLRRITEAARELADARYAALGVLDETKSSLAEFITVGVDDDTRARIGDLPKGHGLLGLLISDPRPRRVPDLNEHGDRFGFPPNHPPMVSFLGVPLYVRDEVFGNLYLTDKQGAEVFSDIDEELVSSLAAAAAIAIENARLHQRAGELSLLADRERIGRDLHDGVIQRLFATGLEMQGTARLARDPDVAARLEAHIRDLDDTIRQIRSTIFELDAIRLPGPSLRQEILELVAESSRVLGFDPALRIEGPVDASVPHEIATHALAVLREALSNAARHARAARVDVSVVVAGSDLRIEVADDGVGPGAAASGGKGVRNIGYRAHELGGESLVAPGRSGGTVVTWRVPLRTEQPM
jgi:signal transduction histidine kinase